MDGQPEIIPHGREEPRPLLGFLTAKHPTSFVKLRDSFTVNERLRLEVGYDVDLRGTGRSAPWASLHFQLDPADREAGFLEVNPHHISVNKHLKLPLGASRRVSIGTKLGVTTKGHLYTSAHFDSLPLALAAGVVLLLLRQPIRISHRETGGLSFNVPLGGGHHPAHTYSLQERAMVGCTLRRRGAGIVIDIEELSAVCRLRQDDGRRQSKKEGSREGAE